MMENGIEVSVEFSFKGERYRLSSKVDLDEMLLKYDNIQSFHAIVAKNNEIDAYSYLYEVMEQADLVFEKATGLAAEFLGDGHFDLEGFSAKWRENRTLDLLRPLAKKALDVDLDSNPALRNVLLEAYRLGKNA